MRRHPHRRRRRPGWVPRGGPALLVVAVLGLACGLSAAFLLPGAAASRTGTADVGATAAKRSTTAKKKKTERPSVPKGLAQPTTKHPLVLLQIGDSLGEDLGYGLEDVLAGHKDVDLLARAIGDSGLANTTFYAWTAELKSEVDAYHPGLVVVFLGGNDAQGFDVGSQPAFFGTALWKKVYSERVATMMTEATKAKAQVLWVGMPVMGSASFSAEMLQLNAIYESEAAHHKGVRFLSTWKLFENGAGQYAQDLPGPGGQLVEVRDPDGVHIAPPYGEERVASAVVQAIEKDWSIKL